ncbi:MaoC/PaaZ C-terminal domain-containing protein [Guptibacillus hwajinpoensis]|uniref:Acyl dehydratase n=1 Tax=Guptibacillus hwajinpoensis TaxID=208199 RepID=A0ABU0K314_9BACL|nr:MaoC/PaaZ C-terminal domain-containing protein [Alkalihalobacillus hemicentroti]MDQ0483751.1 acyl dehydratase [Alkalihalobacillus hemicentroti]
MDFSTFYDGQSFTTESVRITKDDILDFATRYDPQYFHVNEEKAMNSPYNGIIASGFHTISVVWAKFIGMDVLGTDCLGGVGAESIIWKEPVRPEDELTGHFTVKDKQPLSNNRGLLTIMISILNGSDREVCHATVKVVLKNQKEE